VASDNVVLEDLHNTRNLETTYYVTDTTQASDFYWDRESGLRVNIGILDVHLIPEYEDVDHDGDNNYMLKNPNNSEDKSKYLSILRRFCRLPAIFSFRILAYTMYICGILSRPSFCHCCHCRVLSLRGAKSSLNQSISQLIIHQGFL